MSLLLDALKRAEQEKLARRGAQSHPAGNADVEAARAIVPGARRKLELESHKSESGPAPAEALVEPQAAEIAATASAAAAAAAVARRERESAKAVFAAKHAELPTLAPASAAGKNKALLALVIGGVAIAAAGGAYVWYEINRTSSPVARAPMSVASPRPVTPAPGVTSAQGMTPAPGVTVPSAPGIVATVADIAGQPAASGKSVPPVAVLKADDAPAAQARPKTQPKAAELLVMNLLNESAKAKPAAPLKLSRTIEPPRVSPDVSRGYEALKRGDPATARRHYEAAVAADSTSLDAHLGLAAAAARTGDRDIAASHYRHTLALDPGNPSAIAGLAALADFSRPGALEAQLRADITRYPQSPALHFTLGNLYASQSRWNEAQSAYFDAYRLDPDSADLAFNLAVSLDHLGQSRPAADFYQRALSAARKQAVQFDKAQVSRRIAELKP